MAAAAPAAGAEAAVGLIDAAALATLVGWLILVGILWTYRHTIGGLMNVLAAMFRKVRILHRHPLGFVADKLDDTNIAIANGIGAAAASMENAAIYTFHAGAALQGWIAAEVAAGAEAWSRGLQDLITQDIPAAQADVITFVNHRLRGIDQLTKGLRAWTQSLVTRRIKALDLSWKHRLEVFRRGIDRTITTALRPIRLSVTRANSAIADIRGITAKQARRLAAVERALKGIHAPNLGVINRDIAGLKTRVGKLERDLAKVKAGTVATVSAAAIVAVLSRMGLKWLTCRNVKRAGAATCGLPLEALEDALAVGTIIGGSVGLLEFAREMETVVETLAGGVREFWEVG